VPRTSPIFRFASLPAGLVAGLLSAFLWVAALPPHDVAELAYFAFVPLVLWLYARPSWRDTLIVGFAAGWGAWIAILIWLRHVTWAGALALALALALFFVAWLAAARRLIPPCDHLGFHRRMAIFAGLAGLWILLEWTRTWFLWGFPWAPYALTQWQRPLVLQPAQWTGAWGVGWLLVFFNLALARTVWFRVAARPPKGIAGWFSPDLYVALGLLAACVSLFFRVLPGERSTKPLIQAGVVQPYIPARLKWDADQARDNLRVLRRQTRFVAGIDGDVLLWPEAATPWPVLGDRRMRQWAEGLSAEVGRPILMGNMAKLDRGDEALWQNAVFLATPEGGLETENYYAKRKLVPFGEYVPLRDWLGFLEKFVPVGGDFRPGQGPQLIAVPRDDGSDLRVGPLICYEDVFPSLARESVAAGAELLFVATNNAWFGEGGGAYQHAAHSALRAVETRRPVVRAGNGGWSGWIDSYGSVRQKLTDARGSIYFRGGGVLDVHRYAKWIGETTFYVRHGDWFVAVSAGLFAVGALAGGRGRTPRESSNPDEKEGPGLPGRNTDEVR